MKDWQAYAVAFFAVGAGQLLRVGQKIESGKPIGWRDLFVLCSLLPAFGSLGGAAALHFGWPVWSILIVGTAAGWLGFGAMRGILAAARTVAGQFIGPPEPPTPHQ